MATWGSLSWLEFVVGALVSLAIAGAGYWRQALSASGVLGAFVTGSLIFGLGGWEWGLLLIVFFLSSSALSFYRAREKAQVAEKFSKGHRRDLVQALANAGVATVLAILSRFWSNRLWPIACAGAFAAVNADTWATELGVLAPRLPRLITSGRAVEVGTSGAISGVGTLAALGGALFIALFGAGAALIEGGGARVAGALLLAATVGGLAGSLVDSLLGATVQAIYRCEQCHKETERRVHRCGQATRLVRGWRWMGNDVVNALASVVGAAVAAGIAWSLL